MARNRKRRNDRRPRQPVDGSSAQPGVATANGARRDTGIREDAARRDETGVREDAARREAAARGEQGAAPDQAPERDVLDESPEPIEHATPDVELAEAQLAVGRPELDGEEWSDEELTDAELAEEAADPGLIAQAVQDDDAARGVGRRGRSSSGSRGELVSGAAALPAQRAGIVARLVHFIQGSWRELQRVQWPDRRQVMQATGVVIGFVIVAGVFLGVADFVAGRLVNFILK